MQRAKFMTLVAVLTVACADDEGESPDIDAGSSGADETSTTGDATSGSGATTSSASTSSTSGSTTSTTGVDSETEGVGSTGEVDDGTYAALIRGSLFTDDLAEAQGVHDAVAENGEGPAMALGDFGHDALLGTALLGTTQNAFMGLDQWDNLAGAQTLYADPEFAAAFGTLFAAEPDLELFEKRDDWYGWGDPDAGEEGERWFVVVRGRLAQADLATAQGMHDPLAMGGEEAATALGDVAHVVWLGVEDPHEFFAIDVWTDDASIEAFYGDPDFQSAFGALFEAPPNVAVYRSTDWYQW